jgi:hypothetical protein
MLESLAAIFNGESRFSGIAAQRHNIIQTLQHTLRTPCWREARV